MHFLDRLAGSGLLRLTSLAGISVALRVLSFFRSVIDHDESTYIVIADAVRKGAIYWKDVIDVKPGGIFWLLAGMQSVFGSQIWMMRLLAALFLALTAFFMVETRLALGASFRGAWASGVIYLFLNSLFTFYGVSPNTETFFGLFVMLAFWLALRQQGFFPSWFAGLLLGYGFLIKYVVLFDALALGLFLLWEWLRSQPRTARAFWQMVWLTLGFLIPFGVVYAWYIHLGLQKEFLFYTFEVSSRYPVTADWQDYVLSLVDFHLRFLPVVFFFYVALFRARTALLWKRLAVLWALCIFIPIYLPGKFFGHYFIQLFLPLSMLAGAFFDLPVSERPVFSRVLFGRGRGYALLGLLVFANWYFQKKDYIDRPDWPARLAAQLKKELQPTDRLYVANYHQIIYHLLDRPSPTPYIHRGLLWTPAHRHALGIDPKKAVQDILDSQPDAILVQDSTGYAPFDYWLRDNCQKQELGETERGQKLYLYQRKK